MKTCPHCRQQIPVEARECKFCRQAVVRACPNCGQEIYIAAHVCRWCSADVAPNAQTAGAASANAMATLRALGYALERRDIVVWILITIFTCGIGGLVWQYQIGADINRHGGRERVNPLLDLLLLFVTCGFWNLYVYWKYATEIQNIAREEGAVVTNTDLPVLVMILGFFVPLAADAILQNELNTHGAQPHA
jgi:uncharacterized protein DUF4234/double zinc ribbon protein